MRPTLVISNVDYSHLMNKHSYAVTYEEREGGNGGTAKDGSTILDILAYKAVIVIETNGIDGAHLAALVTLLQDDYVTVAFTDPATNNTRTADFHAKIGEMRQAMWKNGGITWYRSTQITLTER